VARLQYNPWVEHWHGWSDQRAMLLNQAHERFMSTKPSVFVLILSTSFACMQGLDIWLPEQQSLPCLLHLLNHPHRFREHIVHTFRVAGKFLG
jgi:hypothetical protein